jgi:anaerobic selenocysteine-containing dehydrogenase
MAASDTEVHPSICRICTAQCPILVEVTDGRAVKVTGDPGNTFYEGYTCPKGRALPEQHALPSRLLHSLKRDANGVHHPIASEDAMDEVAERVTAILAEHGPRSVALYIGTNSFPYPASAAMATAWHRAIGSRMLFSSNTIDQPGKQIAMALHGGWSADEHGFEDADTWLLTGVNPVISKSVGVPAQNPLRKLRDAVARGMQLVVIDPRRTETAQAATLHLQPRPGEDPTILAGILNVVIADGLHDQAFLDDNAEGFDLLADAVRPFTPDHVGRRADLDPDDIVRAAQLFGGAKRGCATAGTGPSFATRGTLTEYLSLCLNTVCGRWARAGDPVLRPNVLLPPYTARAQPLPPYRAWGFGEQLRVRGLGNATCGLPTAALAEEILLEGEGQVKALFCLGGNPMMAFPDQRLTREAMEALELLVTFDPELSATSALADYVIAPKLTLETPGMSQPVEALKFFTIGLGYQRPWGQYTPPIVDPPAGSDVIEEWTFFHGLAKRMQLELTVVGFHGWGKHVESPPVFLPIDNECPPTTDEIYEALTQTARIPLEEVKRHPHGRVFDEVSEVVQPREEGNDARLQVADPHMLRELGEVGAEATRIDPDRPFLLVPRRSHHFLNSSGRSIDRLTRGRPYNPAHMHPSDLASLGIASGASIEIRSAHDTVLAVAEADDTVRRGVIAMTHAFGGQPDDDDRHRELGTCVGRLIPIDLDFDPISGIPRMGALPVAVAMV